VKRKLSYTLGVLGLAMAAVAAVPAHAETAGIGPYYATPSWNQTLPANTRFVVLTNMKSEAVLDRETGLVWQRTPSGAGNLNDAVMHCRLAVTGGRQGWRLPTFYEMVSLVDPSIPDPGYPQAPVSKLPVGHPFTGYGLSDWYWTTTRHVYDDTSTHVVDLTNTFHGFISSPDGAQNLIWCVRGVGPTTAY
jgi:hypothetical protein